MSYGLNSNNIINILSIDLEDYFQVHAFSNIIKYADWGNYECRVERNVDCILEIMSQTLGRSPFTPHGSVKGTFFILGWIAERYPRLVRRIQKEGHEIACHGYAHQLIYHQFKEEFRNDIRRAKAILEDITGSEVIGYRAPSYSITKKSQWAFEILSEEGFKYDSSIFPIRHDFYGMPGAPRFPFIVSLNGNNHVEFSLFSFGLGTAAPNGCNTAVHHSIIEFPISTFQLMGMNIPISGGGYFRLFPYPMIKKGLESINGNEGKPFIFYIHPWEIDPHQPRINNLSFRSKFRHYINLSKTETKFKKLLGDFQFSTVRHVIEQNGRTVAPQDFKNV
jgi:polysaccharide deacetylase family protein (PEP-CTERM system associated)